MIPTYALPMRCSDWPTHRRAAQGLFWSPETGYLLFAQWNVDGGREWGNIGWRAFSSPDMVEWHDLGVALRPDTDYNAGGCWSGSAVARGDHGHPMLVYSCAHALPPGFPDKLPVQQVCAATFDTASGRWCADHTRPRRRLSLNATGRSVSLCRIQSLANPIASAPDGRCFCGPRRGVCSRSSHVAGRHRCHNVS